MAVKFDSINKAHREFIEKQKMFVIGSAGVDGFINVELLLTSCGFGIPQYKYIGERNKLQKWAEKKGREGMKLYWRKKNTKTLNGVDTKIMELSK